MRLRCRIQPAGVGADLVQRRPGARGLRVSLQPGQLDPSSGQLASRTVMRHTALEGGHAFDSTAVVAGLPGGDHRRQRLDLPARALLRGIGNGPVEVVGRGGVRVQAVQAEPMAHAAEEALLPPPREHQVGDLGGVEVSAGRQDLGLMPIGAFAGDLATLEGPLTPAVVGVGDADLPLGQIPHLHTAAPIDQSVLGERLVRLSGLVAFAVGQDVEPGGVQLREQLGTPTAPVETHCGSDVRPASARTLSATTRSCPTSEDAAGACHTKIPSPRASQIQVSCAAGIDRRIRARCFFDTSALPCQARTCPST